MQESTMSATMLVTSFDSLQHHRTMARSLLRFGMLMEVISVATQQHNLPLQVGVTVQAQTPTTPTDSSMSTSQPRTNMDEPVRRDSTTLSTQR